MPPRDFPKRGDVYWVDFDPARGSEQAGHRPACIISSDLHNKYMRTVVVAAVTSQVKRGRIQVFLPAGNPLPKESEILPWQVMTIDKARLEDYVGSLSFDQTKALEAKLRLLWEL